MCNTDLDHADPRAPRKERGRVRLWGGGLKKKGDVSACGRGGALGGATLARAEGESLRKGSSGCPFCFTHCPLFPFGRLHTPGGASFNRGLMHALRP